MRERERESYRRKEKEGERNVLFHEGWTERQIDLRKEKVTKDEWIERE